MTVEDTRYRVDEPRILAEEISGEVLAIDNLTGAYVSITGSGVAIWNLVREGYSPAQVADALAEHHATDADAVLGAVERFVEELVANSLIVATERPPPAVPATVVSEEPGPFRDPQLERYTDMEDMLLFDPIHDVDEEGWREIEPGSTQA